MRKGHALAEANELLARRMAAKPLRDLEPYAYNSRIHNSAQLAMLEKSLLEFGWTRPIMQAENTIVAGHGAVLAALSLAKRGKCPKFWPDPWLAPTLDLSHLSDEQREAYVIADNRLGDKSQFDMDMVIEKIGDLHASGFDLGAIGFEANDLAGLMHGAAPLMGGGADPDDAPEPPLHPVTIPGDIWIMGDHRIGCLDCGDPDHVEMLLVDTVPHLLVTDVPDDAENGGLDAYSLFLGNVAYVWHRPILADMVGGALRECGFSPRSQIIWLKLRPARDRHSHYQPKHETCSYATRGDDNWRFADDTEPCLYAVRDNPNWQNKGRQTTIWEMPRVGTRARQKPVEAMGRPIENNTTKGQVVYDPFAGSGTTIIAAETTGRRCFAIEADPAMVDVAVRRWELFAGKSAVLEGSQRTFTETSTDRPFGG